MAKKFDTKAALTKAAFNGGGAIAAVGINKIEFVGKQKPIFRGAGKLLLGAFLPSLISKGKKSEPIEQAVAGWNAVAAIEIANGILTKNGKDPAKALSIAGFGDIDPNIMGVGAADAVYEAYDQAEVEDENML